jgi:hypothetical protein
MSRAWRTRLGTSIAALALLAAMAPNAARAQADPMMEGDAVDPATELVRDPVKADFKGAVGAGLIGAELGFVVPALLGARDAWAFIVFPVVGAAGGAVVGYFALERGEGRPELAVTVLVTAMALVIPATVVTLAATAYEPDTEVPITSAMRTARAAVAAGPGLVRYSEAGLLLAPPRVAVTGGTSTGQAGAARGRSVELALVSGVF